MQMAMRNHHLDTDRDCGAAAVLSRNLTHPSQVLKAAQLTNERKREILAAWASDASAVTNFPTLRWLSGTAEPVELVEVLEALRALDDAADAPDNPLGEPIPFGPPLQIQVEPCGEGWAVKCDGVGNEQLFRSGRTAERVARRLGARLAAAGNWAEIHVRLRNGDVAGRFVCPPASLSVGV